VQDLEEVLAHTSTCLSINNAKADLFGCKWGRESGRFIASKHEYFDYIVMSDVVYNPDCFDDLLDTIVACSSPGTRILLSYEKRRLDLKIFLNSIIQFYTLENVTIYEVDNRENGRKTEFLLYEFVSKK
jgi:predicted nicotinamide N-methyase